MDRLPPPETMCKLMQLLPNGIGGLVLSTDFLHQKAQRDMRLKLRYPTWFPTVLGLFKLSQAALNWVVGGVYTPIAQAMMAFQLGGAAYTHVVAEGKPKELGGVVVFSCVTLTAQVQHGALGLGAALGAHALLGALGLSLIHI